MRKVKKFILLLLPRKSGEVRAYSVLYTEPITEKGKRWFRFVFKLENKEAHFDVGGTKEEIEGIEKRIEDFLEDKKSETLIVEYSQEKRKTYFRKFETNQEALEHLGSRKVKHPYII